MIEHTCSWAEIETPMLSAPHVNLTTMQKKKSFQIDMNKAKYV